MISDVHCEEIGVSVCMTLIYLVFLRLSSPSVELTVETRLTLSLRRSTSLCLHVLGLKVYATRPGSTHFLSGFSF